MTKNFVIIRHIGDGRNYYLFRVPRGINLDAGDKVVCDTSRGKDQFGICCCDSFLADPEVVCPLFGVFQGDLRFVTGRVEYSKFEDAKAEEEAEDAEED